MSLPDIYQQVQTTTCKKKHHIPQLILILPLSVTRRDKIHEGVCMVLKEIFGCWQDVSKGS